MELTKFYEQLSEMGKILKMENGDDDTKSEGLSGNPAFALAKRIFPVRRK